MGLRTRNTEAAIALELRYALPESWIVRCALIRNETCRNIFMVSSAEGESAFLCQDPAAFAAIHGARKLLSRGDLSAQPR